MHAAVCRRWALRNRRFWSATYVWISGSPFVHWVLTGRQQDLIDSLFAGQRRPFSLRAF